MAQRRESTAIMTMAAPIGNAQAAPEARPERIGVLLVNLGTPDSCDAKACAFTSGNSCPTRA